MATPVKMPQLGETVVEGTVARWHKQPGDPVEEMEPLLDISTDKIDTEVESPASGTLLEIVADEGETVTVGTVIAYIGEPDEKPSNQVKIAPEDTSEATPSPVAPPSSYASEKPHRQVQSASEDADDKPRGREFISPVVSRIAAEQELDLDRVKGTGLHGRITKKDVLAHLKQREQVLERRPDVDTGQAVVSPDPLGEDEILLPLSAMRRAIADHMAHSVQTSPHVAAIHEADMSAVVRHREHHKEQFARKEIRLTYTAYFVKATAHALREVPRANSRYTDEGLVANRRVHIGMAVAVEDGLLVPVIRDADERSLMGLARAVNELSSKARGGRLLPDETRGGTFTITNHGVGGSLLATPIINQPQAGILGVGAIAKRAIVHCGHHPLLPSTDDALVIRPMCYLSFSFDHRVMDGRDADKFMQTIVGYLQNWEG